MPYTIWQTNHPINTYITSRFANGIQKLSRSGRGFAVRNAQDKNAKEAYSEPAISYGILRGTGLIFQALRDRDIEFWEIDRGFFKPAHFDGYYRISMNGMNPEYVPDIASSSKRFDALNLKIKPWRKDGKHILFCPPSNPVKWFDDVPPGLVESKLGELRANTCKEIIVRTKADKKPIEEDFKDCWAVVTYSSNVAVDALLNGIPAICFGKHPVKGWNGLVVSDIESEKLTQSNRQELFNYLAWQQFTLPEIEQGWPWEVVQAMQKYKSIYVG